MPATPTVKQMVLSTLRNIENLGSAEQKAEAGGLRQLIETHGNCEPMAVNFATAKKKEGKSDE